MGSRSILLLFEVEKVGLRPGSDWTGLGEEQKYLIRR